MSEPAPGEALSSLQDLIEASVRERHGDRFSAADLAYLRERIARAQGILAELDRVALRNSDEPDVVFSAAGDITCP